MRFLPNYSRYEPRGGFRPAPESCLVCPLCGYDIGAYEKIDFLENAVCHADCLLKKMEECDEYDKDLS